MVQLNTAKGVYVGSRKATAVTVGTKKIWPSRTITGYRVAATITSRARYTDRVATRNGEQTLVQPYVGQEDLMIRVKGGSQMLPVTRIIIDAFASIFTDGNPIDLGIKSKTVCELLAPIYAD